VLMKYTPSEEMPKYFRLFWRLYPKKVGRGAALKSWISQELEEHGEMIVSKLKAYQFPEDKTYVPHPSTFLNQWRWEDTFDTGDNNVDW